MKRTILLLLLTWAGAHALAQDKIVPVEPDRPDMSILRFMGVNNTTNELIPAGEGVVEAQECVNFFLNGGILNKRSGFVVNQDAGLKLRGIFGYRKNDGGAKLFAVESTWTNTTGNYATIYHSNLYKSALVNSSPSYLFLSATPSWATWDDFVILGNGKNQLWRYNGSGWRPLVISPPGIMEVSPIRTKLGASTYKLQGDYYYAIQTAEPCSTNTAGGDKTSWSTIGQVTGPVHVDSGVNLLYYWPHIGVTDICTPDSSIYRVCRTRAGKTPYDSFFVLSTVRVPVATSQSSTFLADSTADVSLSTFAGLWDTTIHVADTTSDTFYHVGQPTWMGTTTGGGGGIGVGVDDSLVDYYRYGICWYDSSTGMLSPMGPIVRIPAIKDGSPQIIQDSIIQLGIYMVPPNLSYLWRIIYRAREYKDSLHIADSAYQFTDVYLTDERVNRQIKFDEIKGRLDEVVCGALGGEVVTIDGTKHCRRRAYSKWWSDTTHNIIGPFYPVDTVKDSSVKTYNDTVSWASVESRNPYLPVIPTGQWNYPVIYQNRLFAAEKSNVYFTAPGKIAQFENYFPVSLDDGDLITALHVVNDELLIFKTKSVHKAVDVGDGYEAREFISGIGCIAPHSVMDFPGGGFGFLSYRGFYAFTGYLRSPYKETGGNIDNISDPIQNHLNKYTIDQLWECHAWMTPDGENLFLSFPTIDTSWVYAIDGSGWSAATFAFRQTAMYDTTYKVEPRQSVDILGIKNASDSVYIYGDSTFNSSTGQTLNLDAGDTIWATYKTRPLFKDYWLSQLTDYGLWIASNETTQVKVYFYDHNGNATDTIFDTTGLRYKRRAAANDPSHYWQIKLQTKADSVAVQGLDIWVTSQGEPTKR